MSRHWQHGPPSWSLIPGTDLRRVRCPAPGCNQWRPGACDQPAADDLILEHSNDHADDAMATADEQGRI